MYRFHTVTAMSRTGVYAVAAALAFSVAACSDDSTGPQAAAPVFAQGPSKPAPKKATTVTAQIVDIGWNNITELPTVRFYTDTDTIDVQDNSPKDKDPTPGLLKVNLGASTTYSACVIGETQNYIAVPGNVYFPVCGTATPGNSNPLPVLYGYMRGKPKMVFSMWDNTGSTHLVGGTVELTTNGATWQVADGDATWDSPAIVDGWITVTFRSEGTLDYCEVVPPVGYALADNACDSVYLYYDGQSTKYFGHAPAPTTSPR